MEGPSNANRHPQLGPRRPALRALKTPTEVNMTTTSKKVNLKRKRVRFLDLEESCPLILLPLEETSGGNREDDEVVIVKIEEVECDSDAESNDGGDQDRLVTMEELKQEDVTMKEVKEDDVTLEQVKEEDVTMDQVKGNDVTKKAIKTLETSLKEKDKQLSEERERLKALEDELFGATFLIRDLRQDLQTKEEEMETFKRITQETHKKLGRELEKQLIISGEGEGRIMQLENQVQEKDKQMEGLRRQLEREREMHRWDTEQLNLIIRGNNQQIQRLKNLLLGGSTEEEGEREGPSENFPPLQLELVGSRDSRNYNLAENSSGIDEEPKNTAAASFNQ